MVKKTFQNKVPPKPFDAEMLQRAVDNLGKSMAPRRTIWCVACGQDVEARLTNGAEIYPHRQDLTSIPFWRCDTCENYVGCHHKSNQPTKPLGHIATPELYRMRRYIHAVIDPLWRSEKIKRGKIYDYLSKVVKRPYHTGEITDMEEAKKVYKAAMTLKKSLEFKS